MLRKPKFNLIAACDKIYGIGKNNILPWNIPNEIKFFKKTTTNINNDNFVIMGYNTWKSIPDNFKPLKERINIVLTKDENKQKLLYNKYNNSEKIMCFSNIDTLIDFAYIKTNIISEKEPLFWIIGGANIYYQFLSNSNYLNYINNIILTKIDKNYNCDTYLNINDNFLENKFIKLREINNIMNDKNLLENINIKIFFYSKKNY